MDDFKEECTGCGACAAVCPFLAEYGTPDLILAERPEASFYCTSCHACAAVCPLDLSPADAFFAAKERLVREDRVPVDVRKGLDGARGFAKTGHGFPFSFYGSTDAVFWPGCGLAANRPGLARQIPNILSRHLGIKVGLILDCCFDPVYEYGDTETARNALREINRHLRDSGVSKVITGCLNCHKLLSQHLEGMEVTFILEVLPLPRFSSFPGTDPASVSGKGVYLHHPCPSARWKGIRSAAEDLFNHVRETTVEVKGTDSKPVSDPETAPQAAATSITGASEPRCCGAGGGLCSSSPELAERFLERIIAEGRGLDIVTYCIGCQNRFLSRGVEAVHLLECLPGVRPRRKVPSPLTRWGNRLVLALGARMNPGKIFVGFLIALLVAGAFCLHQQHVFSVERLTALLAGNPVLAPLIFIVIYAVAPALFLPSIPLTLAAGFFWGPVWGVVFSISGATVGSCLPFFLSRYLFQNAVKAKVPAERWEWLQDKVRQYGWQAVAFTRLMPVFPFNLLNYLFGLTPIPFRQYMGSTFIFMLPACIAFVAFGSSLGELIMRGNVRGVVIGAVIAIIAFLLPVALRPFFRKIGENETAALHDKPREKGNTEKEI